MKVQQLKQSVNLQNLEDWGKVGLQGTAPIQVSGVQRVIKGSMRFFEAAKQIQALRSHRNKNLEVARIELGRLSIMLCRPFPLPKSPFDEGHILQHGRIVRQAFSCLVVSLKRRGEVA